MQEEPKVYQIKVIPKAQKLFNSKFRIGLGKLSEKYSNHLAFKETAY